MRKNRWRRRNGLAVISISIQIAGSRRSGAVMLAFMIWGPTFIVRIGRLDIYLWFIMQFWYSQVMILVLILPCLSLLVYFCWSLVPWWTPTSSAQWWVFFNRSTSKRWKCKRSWITQPQAWGTSIFLSQSRMISGTSLYILLVHMKTSKSSRTF